MKDNLQSTDYASTDSVGRVSTVTGWELFYDKLPDLIRVIGAIAIIGIVGWICGSILFSHDEETRPFKQAAFTALVSFGSGAIGFLFGSWSAKEH